MCYLRYCDCSLCHVTGILCVIFGIVIVVFDLRFPSMLATFFSADVLQDADEVLHDGNVIYWVNHAKFPKCS